MIIVSSMARASGALWRAVGAGMLAVLFVLSEVTGSFFFCPVFSGGGGSGGGGLIED